MAEFKLESAIPIPTDFRTTEFKYPLEDMKIGDSFFIAPNEDETVKRLAGRLSQATQAYQKRMLRQGLARRYTKRLWTENEQSGYRVWRVE